MIITDPYLPFLLSGENTSLLFLSPKGKKIFLPINGPSLTTGVLVIVLVGGTVIVLLGVLVIVGDGNAVLVASG